MNENVAIVFLRDLLRFHSLSLSSQTTQQVFCNLLCIPASKNAILVLVLFCLTLQSPFASFYLHLMLAQRALRDLFFPFFSECSVLSVSTFLRRTNLLCTIFIKKSLGVLFPRPLQFPFPAPLPTLKYDLAPKRGYIFSPQLQFIYCLQFIFSVISFLFTCIITYTIFSQFRNGLLNEFFFIVT